MQRRLIVALLALAIPTVWFARDALACSCGIATVQQHFKRSAAVFVGTIKSIELRTAPCGADNATCKIGYRYKIAVEGVWKGEVGATAEILTGVGGGDCGFGQVTEKRWVFMPHASGRKLEISTCGGTRKATKEKLAEMTKVFGAPTPPKKALSRVARPARAQVRSD